MLNFIYLSDHVSVHTPADIVDGETSSQVKNEDAFGHGFSIAGCLFLHLLDQRDQFKLFDYNRLVKKLHDFEEVMTQILHQSLHMGRILKVVIKTAYLQLPRRMTISEI